MRLIAVVKRETIRRLIIHDNPVHAHRAGRGSLPSGTDADNGCSLVGDCTLFPLTGRLKTCRLPKSRQISGG